MRVVVLYLQFFEPFVHLFLNLLSCGLTVDIVHFVWVLLQIEEFPRVNVMPVEVYQLIAVGANAIVAATIGTWRSGLRTFVAVGMS